VIPNLGGITGTAPVTADMSGVVAPVVTATGVAVLGSTLKEWIRRGDILTLHKDTTTGAPRLMVDLVAAPTPAGSSLTLGDLNNVAPAADTAAAGMLLGTTSTGQWAPVAGQMREAKPNGTDSVLERFDGAAWVPIVSTYRSGVRDCTSLLANGWAGGTDPLLRAEIEGATLTLMGSISGTNATTDIVATLPPGWRPAKRTAFVGHNAGSVFIAGELRADGTIWMPTRQGLVRFTVVARVPAIPTSLPGTPAP
jgi:hypothetical protein